VKLPSTRNNARAPLRRGGAPIIFRHVAGGSMSGARGFASFRGTVL
jgi:hypothetical protein